MSALRRKLSRSEPEADFLVRLRADLKARGVAADLAGSLAQRICARAAEFDGEAYALFLDGVAAAHQAAGAGAPASVDRAPGAEAPAAAEIQRLVQDFATELKKLDEGLRLLSAYLLRLRDRAAPIETRSRTVH